MNRLRRQNIKELTEQLNYNLEKLNMIKDEEEDAYNNMPENLQCSIRGEDSENAIDILSDCIDQLENIIDDLGGI